MDKNNHIKVSLVVAIYKSACFLPKLIESIIAQTHTNIEIILVEDGSPDESGKICDKYAAQDNRIIVIHQKNQGTCMARNNGMKIMTGEYFSIIDGDDWLEPDYVEYLLGLAVSMSADMAISDSIFTTRDRQQNEIDSIAQWSSEKAAIELLRNIAIGPWNKIYRTEFIKEHRLTFSVPWSGEGLYFITMASQYANYVAKGSRKVYNYRLNNTESGLTKYNVQMGLNAQWNINNIKKVSPLRTKKLQNAIDWHIWKNYAFLYKLIIATNSRRKYFKKYVMCRVMIRIGFIGVLWRKDDSGKRLWSDFKHALLPTYYAKKAIHNECEALKADKLELL